MSEQRDEIRAILAAADAPMAGAQIYERAKLSTDRPALGMMLHWMVTAGEIAKYPAPLGAGAGVRFVYGPAGGEAPAIETAAPEAAKVQRNTAKPAAKKSRKIIPRVSPKLGAHDVAAFEKGLREGRQANDRSVPVRWALTEDGAFVLLGTAVEIAQPQAVALVAFVRRLDQARA